MLGDEQRTRFAASLMALGKGGTAAAGVLQRSRRISAHSSRFQCRGEACLALAAAISGAAPAFWTAPPGGGSAIHRELKEQGSGFGLALRRRDHRLDGLRKPW
jgi:hypothetical protein